MCPEFDDGSVVIWKRDSLKKVDPLPSNADIAGSLLSADAIEAIRRAVDQLSVCDDEPRIKALMDELDAIADEAS